MENSPEFSRAVSQMTLDNIFFTALFYNLKVIRDDNLQMPGGGPGVACTDGVRFTYRADTFRSMFTNAERVSVLAHEILHVILYHPLRRSIRDPLLWNIACDHAVNLLLKEYGFAVGKEWLCDAQHKGLSAEQIYDKLLQNAKQGGGNQPGSGQGQCGPTGQDVLEYDPNAEGNEGKSKAEVEREIGIGTEKALQAAKASGQLPANMKRLLEDAQVVREPWYQHLRRFMTSLHSRTYNWSRINTRRAVLFGIVSPDFRSETMGKIVAAIDCSGSISSAQLGAMGAHLSDLARECAPKEVVVLYFDSRISHEEVFEGPDYQIELAPHGGGGTAFEPIFDRVEERHNDAQVVLVFTDMYANLNFEGPSMPVLWVTPNTDANITFGEIIPADFHD